MEVQEFNIYRYKPIVLDDIKKAILVYAYSKRAYRADITPFFKSLKSERVNLLNTMIASEMPTVTFADK